MFLLYKVSSTYVLVLSLSWSIALSTLHDVIELIWTFIFPVYMIQICSGITSDRVLNGKLYAQRLQKLI